MTMRRTTLRRPGRSAGGNAAPTPSGRRTAGGFVVPGALCAYIDAGCDDPRHHQQVGAIRIHAGTGRFHGRQQWEALRLFALARGENMVDISYVCDECKLFQRRRDQNTQTRQRLPGWFPGRLVVALPYVCDVCDKSTRRFAQDETGRILCGRCYSERDPNPVLEPAWIRLCACGCGRPRVPFGSAGIWHRQFPTETLDTPDEIDTVRVEGPAGGLLGGDDSVIEHSTNDRVLPGEVQLGPL